MTNQDSGMNRQSIVGGLAWYMEQEGLALIGHGDVCPEICLPGTAGSGAGELRLGVIGAWADLVTGTVAAETMDPRIALTLDLEVQSLGAAHAGTRVRVEAAPVKVGRSGTVCRARFDDAATGDPVAVAYASFMASPDPEHVWEDGFARMQLDGRTTEPLAERMQLRQVEPGVVELPHLPDGLNASGAIQGGLVAVAVEEAARSTAGPDARVEMFNLRYLRPFTVGPARATATRQGAVVVVELEDAGAGKLGAVATVRLAD